MAGAGSLTPATDRGPGMVARPGLRDVHDRPDVHAQRQVSENGEAGSAIRQVGRIARAGPETVWRPKVVPDPGWHRAR
jgi:hypothetical protein